MQGQFDIVDVSDWEVARPEPEGRSGKDWLREPGASVESRERDWLFKPVVVHDSGHQQGGDWAEKVVSELAHLLGVPCAEVRLATRAGVPGSLSRNVAPDRWNLMLGYVLMAAALPGYVGGERLPGRPGHSPGNVLEVLAECDPPPGFHDLGAAGVFAGYLVLDAWVANQDRHDRNWAVLERADAHARRRLAASFDHTSSLGFNLLDAARERILRDRGGIETWVARGRAGQFEHDPEAKSATPSLVALAHHTLRLLGPPVERYWLERLSKIDPADVESVVARVPGLSGVTATFILEVLATNRRRLTDDR